MTRVLVTGMTPQTASAVELIVRAVFGAATIVRHDRTPSLSATGVARLARPDDLCVVDLLGFGWARCTAEHRQALCHTLLGPRAAILLLPPGESGWAAHLAATASATPALRLVLDHPASMTAMRDALQRLRDENRAVVPMPIAGAAPRQRVGAFGGFSSLGSLGERMRALVQPAAPPPAGPARPALPARPASPGDTGLAFVDSPSSAHSRSATPPPAAPRAVPPFALAAATRQAVCAACPAVAANPFLSLVLGVALHEAPHAFHIGRHTGAVFHPRQNWVASNIDTPLRKRLTQHRLMLEIAALQPLTEAQAGAEAAALYGRRSDGRRPLDSFIWALVYNSFNDDLPAVDGALAFQLRRLPNFTRLPPVPDAFVQMALLCLRGPQTVAALRQAYPALAPGRVGLFVLCALLSGLGVALPAQRGAAAPAAATSSTRPVPPVPRAATPQRSFIRSLLAKLF